MYSADIDLTDENNSHTLIVKLVGRGRRVLDLGCADGSLGQALTARGCTVTGVELDPEAARIAERVLHEVHVADLETTDLAELLPGREFDAVVLGDVLEHMSDPDVVLRAVSGLLAPNGCVVASVPNVAHGGVRLALLTGAWEYQDRGLLDRTHLRFFTRRSMLELLEQAGLLPLEVRATTVGVFEGEVRVAPQAVPADAVALVESDPDALAYQFVVKAVVDKPESELAAVAHAIRRLERDLEGARRSASAGEASIQESAVLRAESQVAKAHVLALEKEIRELESELAERDKRDLARVAEMQELHRRTVRAEALRSQADELLSRRTDQIVTQAARRVASRFSR